jgi:hypothetical protein
MKVLNKTLIHKEVNYVSEKLLIEMFNRIKALEEKVEILEERVLYDEKATVTKEDLRIDRIDEDSKVTRNTARKYVISKLIEYNPECNVVKGNREANADILISHENKYLKCKFNHSKSHIKDIVSSWHIIDKADVENDNYDVFIFTVEFRREVYTFLFTNEELRRFLVGKPVDKSQKYHLYFQVTSNRIVESRDGERDATIYLDRWLLPKELLTNN